MKNIFQSKPQNQNLFARIILARELQSSRFHSLKIHKNADMNLKEIKKFCQLAPAAQSFLNTAAENLKLSNRAYLKVIKVAQTIADMDRAEEIGQPHIAEALQYRKSH